jgi:hypothetical protein
MKNQGSRLSFLSGEGAKLRQILSPMSTIPSLAAVLIRRRPGRCSQPRGQWAQSMLLCARRRPNWLSRTNRPVRIKAWEPCSIDWPKS